MLAGLTRMLYLQKPCLVTAFRESGCALDDIACQCSNNAFKNLSADCQAADCGVLELQSKLCVTFSRMKNLTNKTQGYSHSRSNDAHLSVSPFLLRFSVSRPTLHITFPHRQLHSLHQQTWPMLPMTLQAYHPVR